MPMNSPTPADSLDMFAELPRPIQVAVLSHVHSMRSRGVVAFTHYDALTADYIEASGLLNVRKSEYGVRFTANEQTAAIRANWRACLEMTGIGLAEMGA